MSFVGCLKPYIVMILKKKKNIKGSENVLSLHSFENSTRRLFALSPF